MVSTSVDKLVKVWDNDGNCIASLQGHSRYVNCAAISKDLSVIISGNFCTDFFNFTLHYILSLGECSPFINLIIMLDVNLLLNLIDFSYLFSVFTSTSFFVHGRLLSRSRGSRNSCKMKLSLLKLM